MASHADIGLALFDLSMPGMNGPASMAIVKETYPDVRVAVVTGSEEREHVLAAVSIGLSGYILKSHVRPNGYRDRRHRASGPITDRGFDGQPHPTSA